MIEATEFRSTTPHPHQEDTGERSSPAEQPQLPLDDPKTSTILEECDNRARRAARERLDELYQMHAKRGLTRSGATLIIGIAVFEEEARSLIGSLVREGTGLPRNTEVFGRIVQTVEQFLTLLDEELQQIVKRVEVALQDPGKLPAHSQGAELLWADKRAGLLAGLEQYGSEFTARIVEAMDEAKEELAPRQTCMLCRHWEPCSEAPESQAGLCRKLARQGAKDGQAITRAGDGCADWAGEGFYKSNDGTIQADRRAYVRTRVDWPALLRTPAGEWAGRIDDISEKGARLKVQFPPRVGASALLEWNSHEVFCKVMWTNKDSCGVSFDKPLPRNLLVEMAGVRDDRIEPMADPMRIPAGKKRNGLGNLDPGTSNL